MDSDIEEMLAELFDEEDQATINDEKHLLVLTYLAGLLVNDVGPRRVGSTVGRCKSKPRQWYEGHCMLYSDYFTDDRVHDEKVF